jgi:HSP20 family protein
MVRSLVTRRGHGPRWLDVPRMFDDPRLFEGFRREVDRLWEDFFGGDGGQPDWFAPRTNIAESDKAYEISLDLPGMKPEDFTVEVKDGNLWITGERKQQMHEEGKTYHCVECQYGQFRRVIPLGESVKADKIQAEYKDGVLRLSVPKAESAQPKRIEVKA